MKILHEGKSKPYTDNWYWRCPNCHTIGYHETEDHYKACSTEGWYAFRCPICDERIRNDRYFNRFIAWLLYKLKYRKEIQMTKTFKGYVARDKDGSIWFHYIAPHRENDIEKTWWGSNDKSFRIFDFDFPQFKDLTWDGKPCEVELTIKRL